MKKFFATICAAIFLCTGCGTEEISQNVTWGQADAKEIDINSKIPGRVVKLLVEEGDAVKSGQIIAKIDRRDLDAQKLQLEANIAAIEAQQIEAAAVTKMQRGTTESALAQAQAAEERARADLVLCEADFNRYSELLTSGAVSRQVFEQYKTKFDTATAVFAQSQAVTAQARANLLQTNVNEANEVTLAKKLDQARASLEQLEVSIDETDIKIPFNGIITAKYVEEGSIISQGTPIVAIQDPFDNWIDLKVPETQLSKFYLNQRVELVARDEITKVSGTVTDISRKSEFATQRATSERGSDGDIITFNVKIQVNSDLIRPGMRFRLLESAS